MRFLIYIALLCFIMGASADAQSLSCNASAGDSPTLRAEGLTELVGDILVTCTGGTPTPAGKLPPSGDIQVSLNVPVTSRKLTGNFTESLLQVDSPANSFQGQVTPSAPNALTFSGVPINPPGPSSARIFRITNVRVNAGSLVAGGSSVVVASVSIFTSAISTPRLNGSPIVGILAGTLTFSVSPVSLTFSGMAGENVPAQSLNVSGFSPINFTVSASTTSEVNWLSVNLNAGTTPATVRVSVNTTGLAAGTYSGTIVLRSATPNTLSVPVVLNVSAPNVPTLSVAPSSLTFTVAQSMATQTLNVASTGAPIVFKVSSSTSSGGNWMTVNPVSGTTAALVTVSVNGAGLAIGTYTGQVSFTAAGSTAPVTVPVTLNVTQGPAQLLISLSSLPPFTVQAGTSIAPAQTISITSAGGGAVAITAVPQSTGNWLSVMLSSNMTPSQLTVRAEPGSLAAGSYNGSIAISAPGAPPTSVSVTLNVVAAPALIIPKLVTFTFDSARPTVAPPPQNISITSRDGSAISFRTSISFLSASSLTWATATQSRNVTPAFSTLSLNPSGLGAGNFVALVSVTPTSTSGGVLPPPQQFFLEAKSSAPSPFMISPDQVSLSTPSASLNPDPVTVSVNNSGSVNFTATPSSIPGGWLSVDPLGGTTPARTKISVNTSGLAPNPDYIGKIPVNDLASTPNGGVITVRLAVGSSVPLLAVSTDSLTFNYRVGDPAPPAASVTVSASGLQQAISTKVTQNSPWLVVSGGTPPSAMNVSINPAGLNPGEYDDSILITSPGAANQATVGVHLSVQAKIEEREVSAVVNAASFADSQPVTAGSLVTLKGTGLAAGTVNASSIPLPTTLGDVSVTFNGIPAPLLFVSATQINAQLPWNLPPSDAFSVVVTRGGTPLPAFSAQVGPFSPGIFSDRFGIGHAIAVLTDGMLAAPAGSIPGLATRPARPGEAIQIYATGLGAVASPPQNGQNSIDALRATTSIPTVLIGGRQGQVLFSGLQAEFVGVNQVNAIVPDMPPGDAVPLQIRMGSITSTDQVTIAVGSR